MFSRDFQGERERISRRRRRGLDCQLAANEGEGEGHKA